MLSLGNFIHVLALPYADLILLSATSTLAILANLILSICIFEERFMWRYDLTAIVMIISGTMMIVFMANTK